MRFSVNLSALLLLVLGLVEAAVVSRQTHGAGFVPDAVLVVTQENITQSCLPSKSNVLINGTSPGPELRLLEGQTYWIRVYNKMITENVTIVGVLFIVSVRELTTTALAWSLNGGLAL